MRMKFFRMRPDTCASTWCLFSSSTLNMALGKVSTTVAITSIASSFDKPYPDSAGSVPALLNQLIASKLLRLRRSPRPCAQSARSNFHPALLPSSRRSTPEHPACPRSPWARSQSPCPRAASVPDPDGHSSEPADLHAAAYRCHVPQTPAPH